MSSPAMMQQHAQPQFAKMDPRQLEALEAPLIALTKQCGGDLRNVLYAFFHFLHRRTDFYLVPHDDDLKEGKATMGFREGDAEKLLLVAFRQFPLRRIPPTSQQQQQQRQSQSQPSTASAPAPSNTEKMANEAATKAAAEASKGAAALPDSQNGGTKKEDADGDVATTVVSNKTANGKNSDEKIADMRSSIRLTEDGLQIPVGNGGSTKRYKWTQTLEECSVLVGIPAGLKGKDLDVTLKKSFISVRSKKPIVKSSNGGESSKDGDEPSDGVFLEGNLSEGQEIVPSESTWSLEGGVLVLVLYKHQKTFWATVLDGDDKIDTSMVDSRRHIGDYDESTQAQIRKIMFDQSQASKGLPTSDQITGTKLEVPLSLPTSQQRKLPPGVEYIDRSTIDQYTKDKKDKEKKKASGA